MSTAGARHGWWLPLPVQTYVRLPLTDLCLVLTPEFQRLSSSGLGENAGDQGGDAFLRLLGFGARLPVSPQP
jgi:hypothetical protein